MPNLHKKIVIFIFLFFLLLTLPLKLCSNQDEIELLFFFEFGCPHCARVREFLHNRIRVNYPVLIKEYEIHSKDNADLLSRLAIIYNAKVNVPIVFVGNDFIFGGKRTSLRKIEEGVREAIRTRAPSPLSRLSEYKEGMQQHLTLPAVIGAAAVDAINPCAFAVLVLLLSSILMVSKERSRIIGTGLAFTTSIFISYLLIGFGLFRAIQITGIQHIVYIVVAILAILIGLWNVKDYFWYGRWFGTIEVPKSWRPKLKQITKSITSIPGALLMGFLVSIFLLPCTSGPYIVIIAMLSRSATRLQAILLLLLYNLIFILPFIIITMIVSLGFTSTEKIDEFRLKRLEKLHLATGIVMLLLGSTMITLTLTGKI
jgi:cytochrome c biogenesis protein CcdA/glutaredoxin